MPIFDQYEVEPKTAYSGSIYAQYMNQYGSVLLNTSSYKRIQVADTSTKLINPDNLNGQYSLFSTWAALSSSYFLNNNVTDISTFGNYLDFFSNETYYDSTIASPIDYTNKNVDSLVVWPKKTTYSNSALAPLKLPSISLTSSFIILLGGPGISSSLPYGSEQQQLVDNKWLFQFPYQSKFKTVNIGGRRTIPSLNSNYSYISNVSASLELAKLARMGFTGSYNTFSQIWFLYDQPSSLDDLNGSEYDIVLDLPVRIDNFLNGAGGVSFFLPDNFGGFVPTSIGAFSPNISDIYKGYFGFGNSLGNNKIAPKKFFTGVPTSFGIDQALYNVRIRGWKYGLFSGFPNKTKCIYRLGKFGQFRDMLEGRITTATLVESEINPYNGRSIPRTLFYPIEVAFVSGTTIYSQSRDYVTATNPSYNPYDSGIYDVYYRSGQPFFDRENEDW